MYSGNPDRGVFAERADSSEGKVEETGVCNCASLGLVVEPMADSRYKRGLERSRKQKGELAMTTGVSP